MGRTVEELSASLSAKEFAEWIAFSQLEPFGCDAEDDRFRQLLNLEFAVNAKAGSATPNWLDRDPEETERLRQKATIESKMETFFGDMAAAPEVDLSTKDFVVDEITGTIVMVDRSSGIEFVEQVGTATEPK